MADRRLPVYLLIDGSGSMMKADFGEYVKQGLRSLLSDLRGDPEALEFVYLSIITFNNETQRQPWPMTELMVWPDPSVEIMGGGRATGAALSFLEKCIDAEVIEGDWKPICFILLAGPSWDSWEAAADAFRANVVGKRAHVIPLGFELVRFDPRELIRIAGQLLIVASRSPDADKRLFKWMSAVIKLACRRKSTADDSSLALPTLPDHVQFVESEDGAGDLRFVPSE